jgi:hypothetical protein
MMLLIQQKYLNKGKAETMQSKTVDLEAMDQKDKNWLEADLSYLSELEPYEWGDADPQLIGKPIRYEQGVGFVVEGGKKSGQLSQHLEKLSSVFPKFNSSIFGDLGNERSLVAVRKLL